MSELKRRGRPKTKPDNYNAGRETDADFENVWEDVFGHFNHNNVAKYIHSFNSDKFRYNSKHKKWLSLKPSNHWIIENEIPIQLRIYIKDKLETLYNELKRYFDDRIAYLEHEAKEYGESNGADKPKDQQKIYKQKIKMLDTFYTQSGNKGFINGVCDTLEEYFLDTDNIIDKMDQQRNLIAFDNGVYDLDQSLFRPLLPQDYISMSTGYNYISTVDSEIQNEIFDILWGPNGMFDNAELGIYVLSSIAYCLHGNKIFREFYVWKGEGTNGKGTLNDSLVATSFGDYYAKIDIAFFTTHRNSASTATPELVNKVNIRFLSSSEPDEDKKIVTRTLKEVTGGDPISCRGLYGQEFTFYAQFGVNIQTNNTFELTQDDKAIRKKGKIIPFNYEFVHNIKYPDRQKLKDVSVKPRLQTDIRYRQQFMLILLDYYIRYVKDKQQIPTTEEINVETEAFYELNNPVEIWFRENVTILPDTSDNNENIQYIERLISNRDDREHLLSMPKEQRIAWSATDLLDEYNDYLTLRDRKSDRLHIRKFANLIKLCEVQKYTETSQKKRTIYYGFKFNPHFFSNNGMLRI